MASIDGFLSTWSKAHATFGSGVPESGERFDQSQQLVRFQDMLNEAAPDSRWIGAAANAYGAVNSEQQRVLGQIADLDRRLSAHVTRSADVVTQGRRELDELREWVLDAAAAAPGGAPGEHVKMAVAAHGLSRLAEIVSTSNSDLNAVATDIAKLGPEYTALGDSQKFGTPKETPALAGQEPSTPEPPPFPVPGQPVDVTNPFIGDERFGQWERVVAPPFTGATPPPLTNQYRPFPEGTPLKVGGTTGMYAPGKTWVTDDAAPYAQFNEAYRFRIAGTEATTYSRMVYENGQWHQERWVQNVYEYQRNTQIVLGGDVSVKGKVGDIGGLTPPPKIDHDWKPIALNQIASLSAANMGVTYYLPDGCGGQITYQGGVPIGGFSNVPPGPPIMTAPR